MNREAEATTPTLQSAQRSPTSDISAARKAWLTLQAELVLAGYGANLIEDDAGRPQLVVSRWALTRSFTSVPEARAWLGQVTGRHAR